MQIPKSFYIFDRRIEVKFDDELAKREDCLGTLSYRRGIITMQSHGGTYNRDVIEQAFIHILLHAMFDELEEKELRDNEKLIGLMSKALHQILQSYSFNSGEDLPF